MRYSLLLSVSVFVLSGCSAIQSSEKSWFQIGETVAKKGILKSDYISLSQLNKNKSLNNKGYQEYINGYKKGITVFCDPNKAFLYGVEGGLYKGQCQGLKNEPEFRYYWQLGRDKLLFPENKLNY